MSHGLIDMNSDIRWNDSQFASHSSSQTVVGTLILRFAVSVVYELIIKDLIHLNRRQVIYLKQLVL